MKVRETKCKREPRALRCVTALVICLASTSCGTTGAQEAKAPRPSLPKAAAYAGLNVKGPAAGDELPGQGKGTPGMESKIYPGTGVFMSRKPREDGSDEPGQYTVNFVNTEIRQVVDRVLGDVLKSNYVIEDELSGTVTIQTANPVSRGDLVPILESALRANGASLVDDDGVFRVIATNKAGRTGGLPGPAALGFGIKAVPLKFISAAEMEKVLEPIAPEGAIRRVDRHRNMIMLSGSSRELDNMLETIRLFDVDWLKGMSFALLPVKSADAETVAGELETIFASKKDGPGDGLVRFMPVKRLNAILAISSQEVYVRRAAAWVERLDVFGDGSGRQMFVYNVQNRPAAELAELLQSAFSDETPSQHLSNDVAPGLEPVTLKKPATAMNAKAEAQPQPARHTGTAAKNAAVSMVESGRIKIIADEANNSLAIIAAPQDYKLAAKMLEQLDVIPNQVLLEATIAEVTLKDELSYGLQWFFQSGEMKFAHTDIEAKSFSDVVAPIFPGFSYLFSGGNMKVALNAISGLTDVKIISSPTLMVLDNKTATLQVGDQVPIVTQKVQSTQATAPVINAIDFRDTGVILKVTPRVNDSGVVLLEIEQEVSDVVETTTSGIDSPTIRQRKIQTSVAVHDGDSLALGGLIRESDGRNQSGVPFLSRVPVLGNLFKTKSKTKNRTELLVLITPRVVRSQGEARAVTAELRDRLRSLTPLEERIR